MGTPGRGTIRGVGMAALVVTACATLSIGRPAAAQTEPGGSQVVAQLGPAFEQLRAALAPVEPLAVQAGAALGEAMADLEDASQEGGATAAAGAGPAIAQLGAALAASADALTTADGSLSPVKDAVQPHVEDAAFLGDTVLFLLKPTVDAAAGSTAPALTQLCSANGYVKPVFAASPYGIVFDGFLIAFDDACAGGSPSTSPAVPTSELGPAFAEYTALLDEIAQTLEPFGSVAQPVADPVCTAASPVFYGAALGAGAIPLPFVQTLSPALLLCALGSGPDPLNDLVIVGTALAEQLYPLLDAAGDAVTAAGRLLEPVRPLLGPLASPACAYSSSAGLVTGIVVPPEFGFDPALYVAPVSAALCGATAA